VVVADYSMPEMDGITLLGKVSQQCPDTLPIMLTAFGDIDVAVGALHQGNIFRFLRKPWEAEEVKKAISDALAQYRLVMNERRLQNELAAANTALDAKVKELDETNHLLEYWVEFSPAVLYSLDVSGSDIKPTYISKNFHRLTGSERTALIVDREFWETNVHPDDKNALDQALNSLLSDNEATVSTEYRIKHASGTYIPIVDSLRVVRNREGKALEIVGCWTDASDRLRAIA
jgi:PAS domain S-box-containing protein